MKMKTNQLLNEYLSNCRLAKKTKSDYQSIYRVHIQPTIGLIDIRKVTKADLTKLIALPSSQTAYKTVMVLKSMLNYAETNQIIEENHAKNIKAPKIVVKPHKFLTWEDLSRIDFGIQTRRIQFLALHGLRFGEAVALTKEDIVDGRIHIKRSKWGETKTPSGVRSVPLLSDFVEFPFYQGSIAKALKPYGVTVHSLRKTYAYILKNANIHVTTASKLMGHSNPMVTLKIYTQVLDEEIDKSGVAIAEFLKKVS
jgi:integrase